MIGGRFVNQLHIHKDVEMNLHNWYGSEKIGKVIPRARGTTRIDLRKGNLDTLVASIKMVNSVFDLRASAVFEATAEEAEKWHEMVKDVLGIRVRSERTTVALNQRFYTSVDGRGWKYVY